MITAVRVRRADDRIDPPDHWLLLRGLARHQKHWAGFDATFAEALGVEVHHLDLPGFGTEHRRAPPLSVVDTMEDVRTRWLDLKREHEGAWGLMSISLGGMVAMAWSASHPDDFAGQVIINSSAKNLGTPFERMGIGAFGNVVKAMLVRDPVRREALILAATSTRTAEHAAMAEASAALDAFAPMSVRHALRQLAAATRFDAPDAMHTPTLLLAAKADALANAVCSHRLASRTGAPVYVNPISGHDLPRDDPGWIVERVRSWLRGDEDPPVLI